MALVVRNKNNSIVPAAKMALAIGTQQLLNNKWMVWDGIKWVLRKTWNRMRRDAVAHPGAFAGSMAAPVAISRTIKGSRPKFSRSSGSVTVTHRELLVQVNNTSAFLVNGGQRSNVYRVNPSNGLLFPWLSTIATNFDQYKFNSVALEYIPLCATTETGRVAMYFDKDSQDPEPSDRVELANMAHLNENAPWAEGRLRVPIDNIKRFTNDSNTSDPKLVDLGQVGFATYGGGGTNPAGDIFVSYTVTFFEPQPSAGLVQTVQTGVGAQNFGPGYVVTSNTSTDFQITFRGPGTYLVALSHRAATFGSLTGSNGADISSQTTLQAGVFAFMSIVIVVIPTAGGRLNYTGTGFTEYTLQVVRARVTNNANQI